MGAALADDIAVANIALHATIRNSLRISTSSTACSHNEQNNRKFTLSRLPSAGR
jgi:hypothetical protein